MGRFAEALPVLRRSLERVPADYSIRPRLFAAIAKALEATGQKDEALATCRAGREESPDVEELLFLEASLLHGRGDDDAAEERLLRLLRTPPGRELAVGDAGRRSYKARHLLAEVYRSRGRTDEAEAQWRLVVAEEPRFAPAWQGLGELHLARGRWPDLDDTIAALERADRPAADALRARAEAARPHDR